MDLYTRGRITAQSCLLTEPETRTEVMNSNNISMEQHHSRKEVPLYLQALGENADTGTRPFPAHTSDGNIY